MPGYCQEVEFGIFPTPAATRAKELVALAELADSMGIDMVSIQDHPYQGKFLDTMTLLSVIAGRTTQIRLSTNVACTPLHPPVMMARAAATLDLLTNSRLDLGLGAGAYWDGIVAAGGPRRSPGQAVNALAEYIEILRSMWRGESLEHVGQNYLVHGLHGGPVPAQGIPIWLGAYKPRMLQLTGRLADGWVPSLAYATPEALPEMNRLIDDAALAAGRSPASIKRIYNISGQFGPGTGFLRGTPTDWAEQLAELVLAVGMCAFIIGTDDPDDVRRIGAELAPATRQLVTTERNLTAPEPPDPRPQPVTIQAHPRVTPTPDDGVRLTGDIPWNEAARPEAPEVDQSEFTTAQLSAPQHLIDVHNALRAELQEVREVVTQVRHGHMTIGQARSTLNTMAMRQNNWTLGTFCQSYCRITTGHHTYEDRGIFPHLRRSDVSTGPVLDRLQAEHVVIHDLLDELDRALVDLVDAEGYGAPGQATLQNLQDKLDLLTDAMLSHLAYEERALLAPLARYGMG
ncbi:LLM class flavin-dependent oxidoreductase [Mycobacteroides abscessus subsp. bolletii]|uniref:LLM class flavin-dependent oxidoreductase n=1 Tax=Mycobacteroides abscessus TaxID=36809 RepID=UPI0019D08EDC|nr:LLM class flavin-dependent oxidoreductase [Mycobacteroides abscessus]MBN7300806.1 LLM class flavin-dependent oxidoreductase [Mycobacteroides abscessus subsp. bolletii]